MGYSVFKFGALTLDGKIQPVPQRPIEVGDIPQYDGKTTISLGILSPGKGIRWIKPNGLNILVADRVLLASVSWEDLNKNGFVKGESILIDGQHFRCRLLQAGESENVSNEWDKVLNETGEDNNLWHWDDMYFWGADAAHGASNRTVRGWVSARYWGGSAATTGDVNVGFRPALEPLPSDAPTFNINLDGTDFQLSNLPGSNAFCPILQPIQKNIFKDIGGKVWMYTFTEDGHPVHMNEQIKDVTKLALTDRYYGDEYLVSWVVSNGVAVADKPLLAHRH